MSKKWDPMDEANKIIQECEQRYKDEKIKKAVGTIEQHAIDQYSKSKALAQELQRSQQRQRELEYSLNKFYYFSIIMFTVIAVMLFFKWFV